MRKSLATAALAAAAVTSLPACGGGSSRGGTASGPPTAASVARQLGCTGVQHIDPTMYAYDEANATCNGRAADIATFRSNDLRDKWVKVASQFSGIQTQGDRYAVADG